MIAGVPAPLTDRDKTEILMFLHGGEISLSSAREKLQLVFDNYLYLKEEIKQVEAEGLDTLRDQFAKAAVSGLSMLHFQDREVAERAYAIADLMIARRLKTSSGGSPAPDQKSTSGAIT